MDAAQNSDSDSDGDGLNDPVDDCPNTGVEEVDQNGCSQASGHRRRWFIRPRRCVRRYASGFPILANGCTDESALDTDLDGDGYSGVYTYDRQRNRPSHQSGWRCLPERPDQWYDQDGDGYGDNPRLRTTPTTAPQKQELLL